MSLSFLDWIEQELETGHGAHLVEAGATHEDFIKYYFDAAINEADTPQERARLRSAQLAICPGFASEHYSRAAAPEGSPAARLYNLIERDMISVPDALS